MAGPRLEGKVALITGAAERARAHAHDMTSGDDWRAVVSWALLVIDVGASA
jgi:hypothetical protein